MATASQLLMERPRCLTPQQQLEVIRDVKLGMPRAQVMRKHGIRYHSTLTQMIQRRWHQVNLTSEESLHPLGSQMGLSKGGKGAGSVLPSSCLATQMRQTGRTSTTTPSATTAAAASASAAKPVDKTQYKVLTCKQICFGHPAPRIQKIVTRKQKPSESAHPVTISKTASMEQRIDAALRHLSKLNQRLIVREGAKIRCICCSRYINFTWYAATARVREHTVSRAHNEMINQTSHLRQRKSSDNQQATGRAVETGVSGRRMNDGHSTQTPQVVPLRLRLTRLQNRSSTAPPQSAATGGSKSSSSAVLVKQEPSSPSPEQVASRQEEFTRDLVQAFLDADIPLRSLNKTPLRDFLLKWTQMRIPRFEEQSLDYGF